MADDEPIKLAETSVAAVARSDIKEMTVEQQYVPRLDGTFDETKGADQAMAMAVADVLVQYYFGYTWHVMAESRQGIVAFSIPDLMGPTLKVVVRIGEHPDLPRKLIRDLAGNLLERMGLRRGSMDAGEYENAKRNMHMFQFDDVGR